MKQKIKQMGPVILIICIIMSMSSSLYLTIMNKEEENCWNILKESSYSVAKEMKTSFENDVNLLHLIANTTNHDNNYTLNQKQLEQYRRSSHFSRIDIIYPNNQVVLENGIIQKLPSHLSFESIDKKGEFMSSRMIDYQTKKEAMYYFVPIKIIIQQLPFFQGSLNLQY